MNTFAQALRTQTQATPDALTENGAVTHSTSRNPLVDLFFVLSGAVSTKAKNADPSLVKLFDEAWAYDQEKTVRILLNCRDIRGGGGRRKIFRDLFSRLEQVAPSEAAKLVEFVPEYGRFDDTLHASMPMVRKAVIYSLAKALSDENGLAAKWLDRQPKAGTIEADLRRELNLSPKQWRKLLVRLTNVVETKMCDRDWSSINYSHVPSVASMRYTKAFAKHDAERYAEWKNAVTKGEAKVNAGALYPHDLIMSLNSDAQLAEAQWNALPNFLDNTSIFPIVDVSGSMQQPAQGKVMAMDISVALGIYLAERNSGPFKNLFMTFESTPSFVDLTGCSTLKAKNEKTRRAPWGGSTNLQASLKLLLDRAVQTGARKQDMPEMLLVISDMQFNPAGVDVQYIPGRGYVQVAQVSNFDGVRLQYANAGYDMPKIVFWNVCGKTDNYPTNANQKDVAMVSGFSPSIMKSVLAAEEFTPESVMLETIMQPRYDLPYFKIG